MGALKALLWDVDGTLAETERDGHRAAFNRAFEAFGVPWRWDEAHYGGLLAITGGRERLLFDMLQRADAPPEAERDTLARALHARKNAFYAEIVNAGAIPLRDGVQALMQQCEGQGVRMGTPPRRAAATSTLCCKRSWVCAGPSALRSRCAAKTCSARSRTLRCT